MNVENTGTDLPTASPQGSLTRSLRVPVEINAQIEAARSATGQSFTDYMLTLATSTGDRIRDVLVTQQGNAPTPEMIQTVDDANKAINDLRNEVRRVGINVMQITRKVNSGGVFTETDQKVIDDALKQIDELEKPLDAMHYSMHSAQFGAKVSTRRRRREQRTMARRRARGNE